MIARFSRILAAAGTLLMASTAMAGSADSSSENDWLPNSFRIGYYYLHYYTHADDIQGGPVAIPGLNIRLKDVYTPYFAYVRSLNEHISVELAAGVPPLTKTYAKGPAAVGSVPYNGQELVSARWLAPTLLFEYNFLTEASPIRPYIGVGIGYVNFFDRNATPAAAAIAGGPTSISLPASVGPAGTVGVAWRLTRHFRLYASYSASEVNTKLTAVTSGVVRSTNVDFGPRAVVVSAGYSF